MSSITSSVIKNPMRDLNLVMTIIILGRLEKTYRYVTYFYSAYRTVK
jgi:hypothetical protein